MYISIEGNKLYSELDKLVDTLKLNLDLDINDVPFCNLGITKNFSKNTYNDTISYIKLQISDMLKANGYSDKVRLESVGYDQNTNIFNITLSASGSNFDISFNGGD